MPTNNHLREWADEARQAMQETGDEIGNLESELSSIGERLDELNSKGALSLSEQDELDRLKQQNAELERKLSIKERLLKVEEKEATRKSYEALESYGGHFEMDPNSSGNSFLAGQTYTKDVGDYAQTINTYTEKYLQAREDLLNIEASDPLRETELWNSKMEEVELYEKKMTEATSNAQEQLDGINIEYLSDEQAAKIKEIQNAMDNALVASGDMGMNERFRNIFDETQFDRVNQKINELAKSSDTINETNLVKYLGTDVVQACEKSGISIDKLKEHVMSLRGVSGIISQVATQDAFKDSNIQEKIKTIISDDEFVIDTSSIEKALGEDFVSACDKAGASIDDVIEYLKTLQSQMNQDSSFTGAVENISDLEDSLNILTDAYHDFSEDGKVSTDTLKEITDAFGSMKDVDAFDNLIKVLGDSKSSMKDVENAMDGLINSYMNNEVALSNVTEETRGLYESRLKAMGITNAAEVVEYNLAKATLESADADDVASKKAWDYIVATYGKSDALSYSAVAALDNATKLDFMQAMEASIAGSNFASVVASHADALYEVADAAGYSASMLAQYVQIIRQIADVKGKIEKAKTPLEILSYQGALISLEVASKAYEKRAQQQFSKLAKPMKINYNYNPATSTTGSNGSSGSGGSGNSKKGKTAAEKRRDKYNTAKENLDHQLEMNYISYNTYYKKLVALGKKYLKGKKGNLKDYKSHLEELANVRREAFDKYKSALDTKLDEGKISINTYFTKVTALEKKWLKGRKSTQEDYADAVKEKFERVYEYYKDEMSNLEDWIDTQNLYKTWAPGKDEVSAWEEYFDTIDKALAEGKLKWADWYKLRTEGEKKFIAAQKEAAETHKSNLDELISLVSDMLKKEKEELIDALEAQLDQYKKIVDAKKESLDVTRAELSYQKEIKNANRELAELQSKAAILRLDTSREGQAKYKALLEEIRQKQEEIAEKQDDHAYDATMDTLDKAIDDYEEKIQSQIDEINDQLNHAGKWLEYVYSYINNTDPSKLLNQLIAYNYEFGTGIEADVRDIWANYQSVVGDKLDMKIEEIIDLLRQQIKDAESAADNDGSADDGANYETIGSMIYQMKQNSEAMKTAKANDDFETYSKLEKENQALSKKISDQSTGTYDNLKYNASTGKWTTQGGTDLFKMISSKGRTAVTIKNLLANATSVEERAELIDELREVAGYSNVFYDPTTKKWYKNSTDYANQVPLFGDKTEFAIDSASEIIAGIKNALKNGTKNINSVKQMVVALRKFSGYEGAFYDSSTRHVYKSALGFSTGTTLDGAKLGKATATRFVKAMAASGSATVNNNLAAYLKKLSGYSGLYYDDKKKKWYKSKTAKTPLYHTGLQAGFVGMDSAPSPKQDELYALLRKGELVLNQSDQDRLMLQMKLLSSVTDNLNKIGSVPDNFNNTAPSIVLNVDAPVVINGNADKTVLDQLNKHGETIANQTLNKLENAMVMRGYKLNIQSNARKK